MTSDRDLVGRCLAGDRTAFDEIVLRYQDVLFSHLLRLAGSYGAARERVGDGSLPPDPAITAGQPA